MKSLIITFAAVFCFAFGYAQKSINDFKYILIPQKFEFQKIDDQYRLNSLTKFLFNKYGYEAYFLGDDLPEDLNKDRCLALTTDVNDDSNMFKTKIEMLLKDCYGNTILKSRLGNSRLKQYDRAYSESFRDAFETFKNLDYRYIPKIKPKKTSNKISEVEDVSVSEMEKLMEEMDDLKIEKLETSKNEKGNKVINDDEVNKKSINSNSPKYYAQKINMGYQLVDATPKIIMILLSTDAEHIFIVKDKNAIVYKADEFWIYSENDGNKMKAEFINIKF